MTIYLILRERLLLESNINVQENSKFSSRLVVAAGAAVPTTTPHGPTPHPPPLTTTPHPHPIARTQHSNMKEIKFENCKVTKIFTCIKLVNINTSYTIQLLYAPWRVLEFELNWDQCKQLWRTHFDRVHPQAVGESSWEAVWKLELRRSQSRIVLDQSVGDGGIRGSQCKLIYRFYF